eukprot:3028439-Pleurochrysis_carterae.AAC.1
MITYICTNAPIKWDSPQTNPRIWLRETTYRPTSRRSVTSQHSGERARAHDGGPACVQAREPCSTHAHPPPPKPGRGSEKQTDKAGWTYRGFLGASLRDRGFASGPPNRPSERPWRTGALGFADRTRGTGGASSGTLRTRSPAQPLREGV